MLEQLSAGSEFRGRGLTSKMGLTCECTREQEGGSGGGGEGGGVLGRETLAAEAKTCRTW